MSIASTTYNGHVVALTAAVTLHAAIAAWAVMPSAPSVMQQQVIQISMVAPSSIAQPKQEIATDATPEPIVPPKPDGMRQQKKQAKKQPQPDKIDKPVEKAAVTPPTTGMQAPDATEKVAARTDPVFNAAYLHNPAPAYPDNARRHGVQGKVMLEVNVSPLGSASNVSVAHSSGFAQLDEAALDAVRRWKFVPAKVGSEVVEAKVIVPVEFKLN
jgi:protein TonB